MHFLSYLQAAERVRAQEGGMFQKKPADFMQMFKVSAWSSE
jgi:hypothetical protein